MLFEGKSIQALLNDAGFIELIFDKKDDKINKFDALTLDELRAAVNIIQQTDAKGMMVYSNKKQFIVGADIKEFGGHFKKSPEEMVQWLGWCNSIFNDIEDLPFPTVSLVNGVALGGGCEMALSTDYRFIDPKGKIGLPEIKLGIMPGFGGSVRLPRLIGVDNAMALIPAGKDLKATAALKQHLVDAIVEVDNMKEAATKLLTQAAEGKLNWAARSEQKKAPIPLPKAEANLVFQGALMMTAQASKGYLAPVASVQAITKAASMTRDEALLVEAKAFAGLAKSDIAQAMTDAFLASKIVEGKSKHQASKVEPIKRAAVLGAGIMGGGVAYQSASSGVPIIMKDIASASLDLGMKEAITLTSKLVKRGKIDATKMAGVIASITPSLSYGDFSSVDIVVEAVTENPKVKHIVIAEAEKNCEPGTIICSNTSSISIDYLAEAMEHPENFCGMHFFNPVHKMPLVEIIRGKHTSERAINTAVAYALQMKKTPIVVNDCPGFLVNRVLFPYFAGFQKLINEGADFLKIDKTMEKFGWPMGPAYLLDVVGMDTAHHAGAVMAEGFPDRLAMDERTSLDVMVEAKRYGQKTGSGFYAYAPDRKGRIRKNIDEAVPSMIAEVQSNGSKEFSADDITMRMMIPMLIETARCLEEGIVDSVAEADLALLYGIGFPYFRGGAFQYLDQVGLAKFCEIADRYAHLGKLYHPTDRMREMAASGETYYKH